MHTWVSATGVVVEVCAVVTVVSQILNKTTSATSTTTPTIASLENEYLMIAPTINHVLTVLNQDISAVYQKIYGDFQTI